MSILHEEALKIHKEKQGKLGVHSKVPLRDAKDLSLAYSPGVAEPCLEIYRDENKVYDYSIKGNLVAVVSDGTAVLGLGNIGPKAAMPVMEGKALLFKSFADVDAFPICLDTTDPDKIVEVVKLLAPTFGGVNLEDISAPQCFDIESRLRRECDIPVFHDDQHGTAIVTVAGLINALKLADKRIDQIRVVVNGSGAAGVAIVKLLIHIGVKDVILCDTKGIIYSGRPLGMNPFKEEMARITNNQRMKGTLGDALVGADVFIGVSAAGALTKEMVRSMNENSIIFAMANPVPEILPEEAKAAGALVVGTGRSDFPNQVNNVLAFPGIFRGTLDVRAKEINEEMKLAAVYAIAGLIAAEELHPNYVIPDPFDSRVAAYVASAVANAAMVTGVSQRFVNIHEIKERLLVLREEQQPVLA
ncbi:NAD-dependent malic enzyme [Bacillus sp. sid0103]|uniref:NAD(P)-dependent malic enzyme n=1 Tax=Bacillus sp. sid0103 TaxID=2856337 RepID=UPI001C44CB65|nr:malic enzyme-like NAD(P)-binding protein [Bacillus sp. sid0103]MBV7505634.1 NAD-dependent malic enzyme [Bacillus sp. sid0103]